VKELGRKAIYDAVNLAGRELSASSVMFHSVLAAQFGLTVTDWRAWDLVTRHGPLTAGHLAKLTGMTPGAATGLIDRLVEAGAVRRVNDPKDRRKVLVETEGSSADNEQKGKMFAPMLKALEKLYAPYSDKELQTIARFMTQMSMLLREQMIAFPRKNS